MRRSATTDSTNAKNYAHRQNHSLQNTEEEPITSGTTAAAAAAHTRYISSPAAATLHKKIQGFVLLLPPQNKAHSLFMQRSQCVLQHHVTKLHLPTHMATPDHNNHATIPMRSAATDSRNTKNYAHRNNHSLQNAEEEHGGTHFTSGTTAPSTAAHTRGTFHRRLQPLFTEIYKEFRAPASSPTQVSPLPFVTTSLPNHFPSSPFP